VRTEIAAVRRRAFIIFSHQETYNKMSEIIRLELKYCERCGGLLLRRAGLNITYCAPCRRIQRALPPALSLHRRPNPASAVVLPFAPASAITVPDVEACRAGEHA
jgi:hypothetical protein